MLVWITSFRAPTRTAQSRRLLTSLIKRVHVSAGQRNPVNMPLVMINAYPWGGLSITDAPTQIHIHSLLLISIEFTVIMRLSKQNGIPIGVKIHRTNKPWGKQSLFKYTGLVLPSAILDWLSWHNTLLGRVHVMLPLNLIS